MTVIVGAGAAGLSLGLMLGDAVIYEKDDTPGGLCRSHFVDGFTFDTGPHILGGIPEAVDWIVESTGIEFVEGTTRNVGWHDRGFVAHPFEDEALGLRYMAKMWKTDPALLTHGLGAQPGRKPGGVKKFLYPASGGYQAITDAWARRLDGAIIFGTRMDRPVFTDTVWTAPGNARYNTLCTVTIGIEGIAPDLTAIYLPDDDTPFHRLSFPSAFAPGNAPPGCYSVQLEASVGHSAYTIYKEEATTLLDRLGLDGPRVFDHAEVTPHAYPVPCDTPPPWCGIAHGRTGAHRYLNLDGVVQASMDLVARLS